jgi:hypothetical protein
LLTNFRQVLNIYRWPNYEETLTLPVYASQQIFSFIPNLLADLALMCRVLAIYPISSTPRYKFSAIIFPLAVCNLLRLVCWGMILYYKSLNTDSATTVQERWYLAERVFTLVDNGYVIFRVSEQILRILKLYFSYVSIVFLIKLLPSFYKRRELSMDSGGQWDSIICVYLCRC